MTMKFVNYLMNGCPYGRIFKFPDNTPSRSITEERSREAGRANQLKRSFVKTNKFRSNASLHARMDRQLKQKFID